MGILSLLGGPGAWVGDLLKTALTGPIVGGLVDGYKAKVAAGNTTEKIFADLAGKELAIEQRERELNTQIIIADEGRWWTALPRALIMYAYAIYIFKCVVWDMVLGLGTTDAMRGDIQAWGAMVLAFFFGGRTIEKVARIIKR